ncbi:type I restriction enzyme S subunit [Keratinibaculum paraultunense]|uniref:Type I restriction enzyme S subunit n=1 Tax=Keratinibaculum paraultunense TaxID=1278232 RepID=A0A4R3L2R2_9FIRM|nr:restriction endonuclease subunit S [Keratinibaculum paraultunense]QQY80296.1 restriction endonuclease subunit S [Keratinibaculum paraultunense]TCS90815.1 type I restriction enzyme S subunit [Keratinibaculum paraultunense]
MNAEIKTRIEMISRGEVPEGYKKTKVGIIPEDWEVKRLGELGKFFRGKGIPKSRILTEGIGCITYGEIYTTYNYTFKNFKSYINERTAKNSVPIKKNDILFAGSGETLEEIGKCVAYLGEDQAYAGGDIVVFRPYDIDGEVLGYLLNHDIVNNQKYKLGQGHSVVHIYAKDLETILIPVIHEKEQQKIAQILSTWDEAIELKEKLIEQKKQQKKGLMQKLLTGEVRLPGFDGEWEEVEFNKIFSRIPSNKYQIKTKDYLEDGLYPVVDQGKQKIIAYSNHEDKLFKIKSDGVIVFGDHTREVKYIDFDFIIGADGTQLIKTKEGFDIKFYYYHLLIKKIPDTGYNRHFKFLKEMMFYYPPLPEQKAIAQILSTADKEIELLEKELELLKLQKKGLMQLLLTGIVRVN